MSFSCFNISFKKKYISGWIIIVLDLRNKWFLKCVGLLKFYWKGRGVLNCGKTIFNADKTYFYSHSILVHTACKRHSSPSIGNRSHTIWHSSVVLVPIADIAVRKRHQRQDNDTILESPKLFSVGYVRISNKRMQCETRVLLLLLHTFKFIFFLKTTFCWSGGKN